jgi:signal transduction histidine kinase/CheY-like chemotaxis protein
MNLPDMTLIKHGVDRLAFLFGSSPQDSLDGLDGRDSLDRVDHLDWELWLLSFLVVVLLLLAFILNHIPGLLGSVQDVLKPAELEVYVDGLAVLVLLFCVYVIQKHRQLAHIRRDLILTQVEQAGLIRRLDVIEGLFEVSSAVCDQTGVDGDLDAILERLKVRTEADRVLLWLVDPTTEELVLASVAGVSDLSPGKRLAIGAGLPGRVTTTREPLLINRPEAMDTPDREQDGEGVSYATALVPMLMEGSLRGVLEVASVSPERLFTDSELRLFQVFGNSVASAVGRNQLIGELRQSLRRNEETHLQLIQAEKLAGLGELMAGISHELNNPLSVVVGHTELLLMDEETDARTRERLEKMNIEALRAKRLIENLLRVARGEGTPRQQADFNEVISQSLTLLQYQLNLDGIELEIDLADALPPTVLDPFQIQQLVFNLVNNARQAMLGVESDNRSLYVRTDRLDSGPEGWKRSTPVVYLQIRDSGPGIPDGIRNRIFDPFFTTRDTDGGTGLGLSICYRIVQEHGGMIAADSHPEGGAEFQVWLPVQAAEGSAIDESGVHHDPTALPVERGTVLIVDDEPGVREVLSEVFELLGHTVRVAGNGKEALDLIDTEDPPDAIVLDLKMPVMDGQECYRKIRDKDPGIAARVLFLTGDIISNDARSFLKESGQPYMSKPFIFQDIKEQVEELIRGPS